MEIQITGTGTERGWGDEFVQMQLSTWNCNLARLEKCDSIHEMPRLVNNIGFLKTNL